MVTLTLGRALAHPRLGALLALLVLALSPPDCGTGKGAAQEPVATGVAEIIDRSQSKFVAALPSGFRLPEPGDEVGWRLWAEYGAVLAARGGATLPPVLIFPDEEAVSGWQATVKTTRAKVGRFSIELQAPAMEAFLAARAEARRRGLNITPGGPDAGRRTFAQTRELWKSRVDPGLNYWVRKRRIDRQEAARIRALAPGDQVPEILRLEKQGMHFGNVPSKSILSSVAAPGASQHLAMLALDVRQHRRRSMRRILAAHGWFQTVLSDLPHFTYLGVKEEELPSLGLKKVVRHGRAFWVPDLDAPEVKDQSQPN